MKNGIHDEVVGTVSYANGDTASYTDPEEYLEVIREELPYHMTTGFQFQTLSNDPSLKAEIEYALYDLYGMLSNGDTEMDGVKSIARILLMSDIVETKFSPMVVQHPFTNSGVTMVPKYGTHQIINLMENPDDLSIWQEYMKERIDQAETPAQLFYMLNKPYMLTFLKFAKPHLSREDFSELLSNAWILSEYANSDADVSKSQLVAMFKDTDPEALMDDEEREQLAALDDPVTVYRGVTSFNAKNIKALSWTLERDTAEWFAHRFGEDGTVYEAQIAKTHILALFNRRNEAEVVLNPKHLMGIAPAQEPGPKMCL